MSLATLLLPTPQLATVVWEPIPTTPHPAGPVAQTPLMGTKWWHCSPDQELALTRSGDEKTAVTSEEPPHQRWGDEKPLAKYLMKCHWEAFEKDSDLVWRIRWAYFRAHCPKFNCKVSHELSHTFQEMADYAGLLDSHIHKVQDTWMGQKELHATNGVAKSSSKDICYFQVVSPRESPKIMGLKGIHSPETLKRWAVVNHLRTSHYHLGLICGQCLKYFTTNSNTMWHHSQGCPSACTHNDDSNDDDHEEESDGGDDNNLAFT